MAPIDSRDECAQDVGYGGWNRPCFAVAEERIERGQLVLNQATHERLGAAVPQARAQALGPFEREVRLAKVCRQLRLCTAHPGEANDGGLFAFAQV